MKKFGDSLRGYSFDVHKRDNFVCQYCGADGTKSFDTWLSFSRDHLLPTGHKKREEEKYIVTACRFCNEADNQYFVQAEKRGISFDGKSREQLVEQRLEYVRETRQKYKEFWVKNVCPLAK
jgi:5-methylcytosine-specific restriction endonuclease McrA